MAGPNSLYGPVDPAPDAGYVDAPPRMGFFTDTSVCIGCKACEVACKEWNAIPDDGFNLLGTSYDNTGGLTANSWRHVAFVEQPGGAPDVFAGLPVGPPASPQSAVVAASTGQDTGTEPGVRPAVDALAAAGTTGTQFLGMPLSDLPGRTLDAPRSDFRWLMMSNVCKHCTHAACLDVCPTGSLFRTEFGTVVVQEDICNGCGYCIPACPYGVIDQRKDDGRAWKCTMCYDRIGDGLTPACAKACPTESIQYGELDELRARAAHRVEKLHEQGESSARLYGHDPEDGVGGDGAFFLLLDEPEVYGLPPDPVVTTRDLPAMWKRAGLAALTMAAAAVVSFAGRRG
ncbi:4Fe-4S dicluster domain-containing protein [Actinoplanes friuliensis]|jgi:formate dehydrogenase iron-sulfur subunit|uniref:Formate dehydrogenase subunit beta n=1 Tax=Actinoplanes friuliensis DSM 7358 TaxID=1246995 RepID=U5W3Z4_9ACTN|nr:4Fe-4S dicluster domain-containing protein [Actinoplanes friuliensis]AGZ43854.1 formate dehydrogenase subunit beta [Actinoplanes friuliensis DSM 7358]